MTKVRRRHTNKHIHCSWTVTIKSHSSEGKIQTPHDHCEQDPISSQTHHFSLTFYWTKYQGWQLWEQMQCDTLTCRSHCFVLFFLSLLQARRRKSGCVHWFQGICTINWNHPRFHCPPQRHWPQISWKTSKTSLRNVVKRAEVDVLVGWNGADF